LQSAIGRIHKRAFRRLRFSFFVIDFLPHGRSIDIVDLASGGAAHERRRTVVLARLRLV